MARKPQPGWQIYKEQMDFLCHGDALWEPAPTHSYARISIGDVGFVRRGQFHLLFSAGCPLGERRRGEDVPTTFEELAIGIPVFAQPRLPGCLRTDAVREVGAGLGVMVSTTLPLEPGASFSFELTGNRGAALVTKYQTYREDSLLESAFEKYTKRHYESWVAFARHKQYGNDVQPVLVSGFDMTRDFAMVAYLHEGASLEADLTIAVPMLASASASLWGTWRTRCSPHTNYGPQTCSPPPRERVINFPSSGSAETGGIPDGFDQCVFVRYYTMRSRKRMPMFPKVIRAGAGPHDLGSGSNMGDTFPELVVESDAEPATSGDEDLGGQWALATDDTDSESDIVVRNTPFDEEYDNWDAVAEYVFQKDPNAVSVLMHHRDLAGIRKAGGADNMLALLTKHRPRIVVDDSGVGRVICQEIQLPGTPVPVAPWPAPRCDGAERSSFSQPQRPDQTRLEWRLLQLDRSSARFPEQLDKLLHDKEWVKKVQFLPEDELMEAIGYLNDILDSLDCTGSPSRKCLHILQKICSSRRILPSTYEVSGELSLSTMEVVAYGGFCDAYRGSLGGAGVCIKRLRISITGNQAMVRKALCNEAVVWKHLDHPNIVPFKGVTFEPLQLVSEWMDGGELREYIRNNRHTNLARLSLDVAEGLGYLHSCNVIHGDLKGANILVDATGNARIVDFGLATVARDSNSLVSTVDEQGITARYTAPEILKSDVTRHTKESDVFSFGMIMVVVFTGDVPFRNSIAAAAIASIVVGERPERPVHPGFTDRLWTLTQQCWRQEPQDRPRMDQVIEQLVDLVPQTTTEQPAEPPMGEISSTTSPDTPTARGPSIFYSSPPLPQPPTNLFGRNAIVDDLLSLVERSASLTLFGAGGIGKTAIALALLHHVRTAARFGRHRHFIRCDDLVCSLDGFIGRLSDAIGVHHFVDKAQLRSHLALSPPCILVLDGVDSILDPFAPGAVEIATTIEEFGRCGGVCILATSRMDTEIPDFCHIEVPTLPVDGARDTFYGCCHLGRSAAVDKLLADLDFHPLSIELLATAVCETDWDEPLLLKAWGDGGTSILKASGSRSLEDNIQSTLLTPTIRVLGTTVRETLQAIAASPSGVQESKLEILFPNIPGVGEAVNALCKFSLLYRRDGFVNMLSPFRFCFLESTQTLIYPVGGGPTHDSTAEDIQYTRRYVPTPGFPAGTGTELPRRKSSLYHDGDPARMLYPTPASDSPVHVHQSHGLQPDTPPGAKLIEKFHVAMRRYLALFRPPGTPEHLNTS